MPSIVASDKFNDSLKKLSEDDQFDVEDVINRIRHNRLTRGTNREIIPVRGGLSVFSYRANDDVRVFTFYWRPGEELLVLCGHHDSSYARIQRMRFDELSPTALPRIVEIPEDPERQLEESSGEPIDDNPPPLANLSDDVLAALGIPPDCYARIRSATDADNILQVSGLLPSPADDDVLELFLRPDMLNDILAKHRASIDKAIKNSDGWGLITDEDINDFYEGRLENWRVFLHPSQRQAVEMRADGPMLVTGPAGTGKSVVAVHRVRWLLRNVFTDNERILLTTFNRALALASQKWLETICTPAEMKRVDVLNFDSVLRDWFEKISVQTISYPTKLPDILDSSGTHRTPEFLCNEFLKVVLEYDFEDVNKYAAFSRPKNCGVLRESTRRTLWPIFEDGKRKLLDPDCKSIPKTLAVNMLTARYLANDPRLPKTYACIVVDEAQDFGASEYRLFAAYTGNTFEHPVPNSLFLAGDGRQRVYRRSGTLKKSGINVTGGRSRRLTKCYRSTKMIREYAERLIMGIDIKDIDEELESLQGGESLIDGVPPEERIHASFDKMITDIRNTVSRWRNSGKTGNLDDYAVLARRNRMARDISEALNDVGLRAVQVEHDTAELPRDAVNVMTMHRAKGLQYRGVIVCLDEWPCLQDDIGTIDIDEEKSLLYVSIMRAQSQVLLTGSNGIRPKALPPIRV